MPATVDAFLHLIAVAPRALLALDYDGTLAPFQRRPQDAVPYPGVSGLLRDIMTGGRTRLVIISGRPAGEVQPLLALQPAPEIWGAHGWERRRPSGQVDRMPAGAAVAGTLDLARKALGTRGLLAHAEWKAASVAVHWRGAENAPAVADAARAALAPLAEAPDFELMPIVEGVELRSRRWNKGTALTTILSEEVPGVPVAYLGDDRTDEDAFAVLAGRGLGLRIADAPVATTATATLTPGPGVVAFLERWHAATSSPRATGANAGRAP